MLKNISPTSIIIPILLLIFSCNQGKMSEKKVTYASIQDVTTSTWKKIAQKKIYFGHQSVGDNIMDGVKDVMKDHPEIKLNVVETSEKSDFKVGLFAHSKVGKNMDPGSKIDAFSSVLENGVGDQVDFAFFKFCWVDAHTKTDIQKVFNDYKENMSLIKKKYPNTTFIHVTIPLTSEETGVKALIKKIKDIVKRIIGRANYYENTKRNQYNEMLIKEYDGKEPIFDLAALESTFPDGTRASYEKNGKMYYFLVPAYTDDAGHLNEEGRKIVAEQLLILLAQLTH